MQRRTVKYITIEYPLLSSVYLILKHRIVQLVNVCSSSIFKSTFAGTFNAHMCYKIVKKQQSKATCWVTEGSSWLPTLPTEEASAPCYKTSKFASLVETKTANSHRVFLFKYFAGQIISSAWNILQIKSSAFQTELTEVWQLKGLRGGVGLRLCLCSNASTLPLYQLYHL